MQQQHSLDDATQDEKADLVEASMRSEMDALSWKQAGHSGTDEGLSGVLQEQAWSASSNASVRLTALTEACALSAPRKPLSSSLRHR